MEVLSCPKCGSADVHRSRRKGMERFQLRAGRRPYRCWQCQTRFFESDTHRQGGARVSGWILLRNWLLVVFVPLFLAAAVWLVIQLRKGHPIPVVPAPPSTAKPEVALDPAVTPPLSSVPRSEAKPKPATEPKPTPDEAPFTLQIGAFKEEASARKGLENAKAKGHQEAWMVETPGSGVIRFRVVLGSYATQEAAEEALREVRKKDYPQAVVHQIKPAK